MFEKIPKLLFRFIWLVVLANLLAYLIFNIFII
jgi:hypothetical protein